jgi:hypothetical protein
MALESAECLGSWEAKGLDHQGLKSEDSGMGIMLLETFDPQTDRIIDPSAGFDDALGCYIGAVGRIHRALPPGKMLSGQRVLQGIRRLAGDAQRSTESIQGAITSALGLARRIKSQRRAPSRRESMGRDGKTQDKRTRDSG